MRKLSKIIVTKEKLLSLYPDAGNAKLYFKAMGLRKRAGLGAWRIARILNVWNRRGTINQWLCTEVKPRSVKEINELENAGLLPLKTSNSEIFRHFVHLFGLRYSDGCIYRQKRNKSYTFYICFGNKNDAKNFTEDCKKIWDMDLKYHYGSRAYYVYIPASIARIMVAVGSPVGRKTSQLFRIPRWIFGLPENLKWEFISGIFTGDGSAPRLQPNIECSWSLKLSLNSEKKIVKNFRKAFMEDLWLLLNQLGIEASKPKIKWNTPRIAKNGVITYPVVLRILTKKENMIDFLENVKYRYSVNYFKKSRNSLNILKGKRQIIELRKYFANPSRKPPKICVLLGEYQQKELIETAANKFAIENNSRRGIYKSLAKHLCQKCKNVKNFHFVWNKYLSDWKYHKVFIPVDCVIEFAKLSNIKISDIEKDIKQVKFIGVHNKFAVLYRGNNDIIRNRINGS